jgi:hypothetical protein
MAMLTDGEGHFEFTLPKDENNGTSPGTVLHGSGTIRSYASGNAATWLMARKPGFLDDPRDRKPVSASTGDDLTIPLIPESLIKGKVILSTNDPAIGVNVQIYSKEVQNGFPRWSHRADSRTNLAGEFRFAELPRGTYRLFTSEFMDNDPAATMPGEPVFGFPPVYYPGVSDFSAASTIDLGPGQTVEANLPLTHQPYYQVRIPIANPDITGGMNISVRGHRGPGYSLGFNSGEHRIEGMLPNGSYAVEASTYDQGQVTGTVTLSVKGGPTEGPPMTLTHSGLIRLEVKEEFSTQWNSSMTISNGSSTFSVHGPRRYLNASITSADDSEDQRGASLRSPTGPQDEALVLENVRPGKYWLQVDTSRGYVASATMGGIDLLHEPFSVGSGPASPIEVTLRDDCAQIDGTVTTLAERAATVNVGTVTGWAAEAWVYFIPLPDSPGHFQQFGVSNDGKFRYEMMAPGSYRVLAFANRQENLPFHDPEGMKAYEMKGPVVHLVAGQKTTIQVSLLSDND